MICSVILSCRHIKVWEVPIKRKFLCSAGGSEFFWRKKSNLKEAKKKKKTLENLLQSHPLPEKEKEEFTFFLESSRTNANKEQKKPLFFFIFTFKTVFEPTRVRNLNFQAKITIKTVKILWRRNQYCINHQYLILLLFFLFNLFLVYFQFLFDYFI